MTSGFDRVSDRYLNMKFRTLAFELRMLCNIAFGKTRMEVHSLPSLSKTTSVYLLVGILIDDVILT